MKNSTLKIIDAGFYTTIQDLGRIGFEDRGIPNSGVMDKFSHIAANRLLGNFDEDAVLEVTMTGCKFSCNDDINIAVTGGDLGFMIDNSPANMWESIFLKAGSIVSFAGLKSGLRSYIAVQGGIQSPKIMNSRSTYIPGKLGGLNGERISAGDSIPVLATKVYTKSVLPTVYIPSYPKFAQVRVIIFDEAKDNFTSSTLYSFTNTVFAIDNASNRMGYRLKGEALQHTSAADTISSGVAFGSIQVPKDGQPIILMADRQVTGGYTTIANIISADIPVVAQLQAFNTISFIAVSLDDAITALKIQQQILDYLKK